MNGMGPDSKILIVDDVPTMRRVVKTLLLQKGYHNFIEAENGQKALQLLDSDPQVSLVISDWDMPEMNGIDLLKSMRKSRKLQKLPFLMIASDREQSSVNEALNFGASNYIIKPFTGAQLNDRLLKLFETKKAG
jgi:two-component system, chemotaxis family, chemotaxis protein CheY